MATPLIGITSYVEDAEWGPWRQPAALIPMTYVRAVREAGGRPLVIPPDEDTVEETLASLDGLVMAGGADIDPQVYGAERHAATAVIRPDRDRGEMALLAAALEANLPVLAICRGMQLLNVVRGGDLVQHLPEVTEEEAHVTAPGVFSRHEVTLDPASRLGRVLGSRALVASHHHQAPSRLGEGIRTVAWAPDETIEGIEDPDARFLIGVLWHPEEAEDRALFEELVKEAAAYRKDKQ